MVMKHIARLILKIFGWKLKGGLPEDKKAVVISVPHTSIMDFIWGKLTFISQGFLWIGEIRRIISWREWWRNSKNGM